MSITENDLHEAADRMRWVQSPEQLGIEAGAAEAFVRGSAFAVENKETGEVVPWPHIDPATLGYGIGVGILVARMEADRA
jgi:hypothetical protein